MMVPSARRVQPLGASSLARVASSAPRAPRAFRVLETRARGASIARLAPARIAPAAADSHSESVKLPRWEGERLGWPERRRGGCERGLNRRRVRAAASPPSSQSPSDVAATSPDDEPQRGGIAGFFKQLDGLWGQLVPMAFMFYVLGWFGRTSRYLLCVHSAIITMRAEQANSRTCWWQNDGAIRRFE